MIISIDFSITGDTYIYWFSHLRYWHQSSVEACLYGTQLVGLWMKVQHCWCKYQFFPDPKHRKMCENLFGYLEGKIIVFISNSNIGKIS